MNGTHRKWTEEEDRLLLQHIKNSPQNLSRCFLAVSEATGRSSKAVAAHWYNTLSKNSDTVCFFTASSHNVSKNRKNGTGTQCTRTIWQRLLDIISNL